MTLRELRVLVTNLPPDCATARKLRGHNWTERDYMLADLVDTARFHRAEWATSKGAKPPKPKPIPRPQVPERLRQAEQAEQQDQKELARNIHQHVLDHVLPIAHQG